jgi:3-methyladenine DNA glycosylase AlkC
MAYKQLKLWFDKDLAELLADKILTIDPSFNKRKFVNHINKSVTDLELKERVECIADKLYVELGANYSEGIKTLSAILGPENKEETGMFNNFYWIMPVAKYIEKYGLDHFELSINAVEEVTKRNTGEYTIRPFLEQHTKDTLKQMKHWARDENFHVRRLSCEGVRPRLPWAKKLDIFILNPKPILPILNTLKDDKSKYVQKSVANCINDILKDNEVIGKDLLDSWKTKNRSKERQWIMKHAVRNLIKKDDVWAKKLIS